MRLSNSAVSSVFLLFGGTGLLPADGLGPHAEYQIRIVTTMTSKSPAQSTKSFTTVIFGRKDGSKGMQTFETIGEKSCTTTTYWDEKSRIEVIASDCIGMKSTVPYARQPGPAWPPTKAIASCATIVEGGLVASETISGLRVDRFDNDDSTVKSALYYAPDLGCQKVKAVYQWKDPGGSIRSTTVEQPTEIRLGPPDEKLFQTDASYREVLPSERMIAFYQYLAGKEPPGASARYERADKRYLEVRRNRRTDTAH